MAKQKNDYSRRAFNKMIAGTCLAAFAGKIGALGIQKKAKKYNILYIMTDEQPVSCLSVYNSKVKTPNLQKLAEKGCVFDNSYIAGFPCAPSRACQLTGRYVHNHQVVRNEILLDNDVPCLGDIYKDCGYRTGYFGKWHLGGWIYRGIQHNSPKIPDGYVQWHLEKYDTENGWGTNIVKGGAGDDLPQHGFDTWKGGWTDYKKWLRNKGRGEMLDNDPWIGGHFPAVSSINEGEHIYSKLDPEEHMAAFFAEQANEFIEDSTQSGQPWCCVLSFYAPHPPVTPPKPWNKMYSLDEVDLPDNHYDTRKRSHYKLNDWSQKQFKDYIRRYWGYCSYIDEQIGKTLDKLEQINQLENTIVVFTSDHGDMVGSHGMYSKSGTCGFEELYKVPLIVYIPGITKANTTVKDLVSSVDLLPTLLQACGIKCPEDIDGKSMVPLLTGMSKQHRQTVFAEAQSGVIVCRHKNYKFLMNWRYTAAQEFYDLEKDPGEMQDLIFDPDHQKVIEQVRKAVVQWAKSTKHQYAKLIEKRALFDYLKA